MPRFPKFAEGDQIEPWIFNAIFRELERWRGLRGAGLIVVRGADGDSNPTISYAGGDALVPAQLTSTLASGSIASPTTATMTLLAPTGSSGALTTTGGTTGVTVYNFFALTASLASGTNIVVFSYAGGWYLLQAAC